MEIPKLQKGKFLSNDKLFIEHNEGAEMVGTIGRNLCQNSTDDLADAIAKAILPKDVLNSLLCFETLNVLKVSSE